MFSYFGSKSKIVHLYPAPMHDRIIEPFAGSARYSLLYWYKDVTLIDNYKVVMDIWKYLQNASYSDIMALPTVPVNLSEIHGITEVERNLLGFCWARGNAYPAKKIGKYCDGWIETRKRMAQSIRKIQHWQIVEGSYAQAPNELATWFIDAPYQFGGIKYKHNQINYAHLRGFVECREGQVIVCENDKANWLNFEPLCQIQGSQNSNPKERIWTNTPKLVLF